MAIEQHFVGQHHGRRFHVFMHSRYQGEAARQQARRELFAEIALVTEEFAHQSLRQFRHLRGIAGGELGGYDFTPVIEHQLQLETAEPSHGSLAPLRQHAISNCWRG